MKVWGRNTSSNVQKVMWTIAELGLGCERIDVGGPFGRNRDPDYLVKNPNGLIPVLEEDDGFCLWESNTIVRYLCGKHGQGTLEPTDPRIRALADQWTDWQLSVAGPAVFPVFWGLVRTPPEKRDLAAISTGKQKTIEAMMILEAALSRRAYVAGEAFTRGDVPLAPVVRRFLELVPERPPVPHIERWYATIAARPAFQQQVGSIPLV